MYNYSFRCIVLPRPVPLQHRRRRRAGAVARVAVAGATGYTGQELLRLLARHPGVRITLATSSSAASAARRLPALGRIWDGALTPLDADALAREADLVFLALPDTAAAELAPALVETASASSICRAHSGCATAGARARWYPETHELPERHRLRPDRTRAGRGAARRGSSPTRAAIRPRRCSPCCRSWPPACSCPAATSSSTRSRESRAPARRRRSGRTSRKCTAACRPTVSSAIATARRSSRASAGRSPSRRTSCRSIAASWPRSTCASPAGTTRGSAGRRLRRGLRRRDLRAAGRRRAAGDQARRAHQFLRHRLARRSVRPRDRRCRCIDNLLKGASGQAVQNMNVMLGLPEATGLL